LEGNITAKQCAHELTLLDHSKFKVIPTSEFLHQSFLDKQKAPNFQALVEQTNKVDLWTQTMVLSQTELHQRVAVLGRFIELASELLACGNFGSSFAIYAALNSRCIARLDATWDEIPKRALRQFDSIKYLFATTRNYEHYRDSLSQYGVVPFLGIISKDLVAIEESNLTLLSNELQNLTKGRLLYRQLETIYNLQKQTYFPSKEDLFVYFANLQYLTSDELYELSIKYEPKSTLMC